MSQAAQFLIIQFLEWIAASPRSYPEVMDAWRTSCPRLSIWEDAVADGLVELAGGRGLVNLTLRGRALLQSRAGDALDPRAAASILRSGLKSRSA